ncbi:MAG: ATP-binding protein [Acidimicrobiales bacterium]
MKIAGWHMDGFGLFADYTVDDLPPGLTVIYGPNEAGKSTTLAFIRGVLFGFPDGRSSVRRYPPLRGGQAGGKLLIDAEDTLDADTGRWIVERTATPSRLTVTLPGGSSGQQSDLERLLGHADKSLFHNIFAFTLEELSSLGALNAKEVRERVFATPVMGAGRSPGETIRILERRCDNLLKPRAASVVINAAMNDLQDVQDKIREARKIAEEYPRAVQEQENAQKALEQLTIELEQARRSEIAITDRTNRQNEIVKELEGLDAELEKYQGTPDLATLENASSLIGRLRALIAELPGAEARMHSAAQEARTAKYRHSRRRILYGMAAIMAVIAPGLAVAGQPVAAAVVAMVAIAALLAAAWQGARGGLKEAGAHEEQRKQERDSLRRQVKELASSLGLLSAPSFIEVEALADVVAKHRESRVKADELSRQIKAKRILFHDMECGRRNAEVELATAHAEAEQMRAKLVTGEVAAWKDPRTRADHADHADHEVARLEEERDGAVRNDQEARGKVRGIAESSDIASLEIEAEGLRQQLTDAIGRWQTATLAKSLIEETLSRFQRKHQPEVIKRASELFRAVTGQHYENLIAQDGSLEVINRESKRVDVGDLSTGTAQQLYLCIRFGLAEEFARHGASLPLIMDEVLVNFDPERARAVAGAIVDVSIRHQVLIFTCHPETVDMVRDTCRNARVDARVIELERFRGGEPAPVSGEPAPSPQRLSVQPLGIVQT